MRAAANVLPEYGGDPSGYTEKQVTKYRRDMLDMKYLLNDVLAFKKGFSTEPSTTAAKTDTDQSTQRTRDQILQRRGN